MAQLDWVHHTVWRHVTRRTLGRHYVARQVYPDYTRGVERWKWHNYQLGAYLRGAACSGGEAQ